MESKHETPYFLSQHKGLIESTVADEFLHPPTADTPGDSLTETQYFGLCIPEQRIHGLFYCWRHPNLRIVTGGVWIFQGMKLEPLSCELFDWHDFMSDRVLSDDFRNFKLPNSYSVTVLEPLKRHRLSYSDPSRGNAFNLEYEALAPPASWAKGLHFDQAMKVRGELSLAGKKYDVNGYNVRDRSWGKLRPEEHNRVPPVVWMTGVFSDDFFFNCTAFDHPDLDPDWQGLFPDITADRTLMGGWVCKAGETAEIVTCKKKTRRNRVTLVPEAVEMTLVDARERVFVLRGEIVAASTSHVWPNMRFSLCMTRWTCNGEVGHGDSQEVLFHDYIRAMMK